MSAAVAGARVLLVVALLAAGWLAVGWWICRRVRSALLPSERLALALLSGAGTLGVTLFVVGQLRFSPLVVLGVAVAALVPLAVPEERRELVATIRALRLPGALFALPIGALFALVLAAALAPPIGDIGSDTISYHLAGPAFWLRHHRVLPVPDMSPTAFPVAVEALHGASMALADERAPAVVTCLLAFVVIVQAYGLARWLGASDRWAPLVSLLVAFMPAVMNQATSSFVDIEYAGFALAAFRLMFTPETARSLVGPLFLGLTMATKYNGLTLTAATLGVFGVHRALRDGVPGALRTVLRASLVSVAFAVPFLLRNLVVLGTPIYPPPPLLALHLPGKWFSYAASVDLQRYIIAERGRGLGFGVTDFLLLPWRYTFHTSQFHGAGGVGIATLAFLPAALLPRPSALVRWSLVWMFVNGVVWFVVQQESRFLIPFVILGTAIAVTGAQSLVAGFPRLGRAAVAAVVAISVGYGALVEGGEFAAPARAAVSARARAARRAAGVPFADAFDYLNAQPEPCRVLILSWSVPPFYLHKDYVKVEGMYHEHPVAGVEDPGAALVHLGELGVTHVLDARHPPQTPSFLVPTSPPDPRLRLVFASPDARVFAVVR